MVREEIDQFLKDNQEIAREIEKIATKYTMTDFVKVGRECKDYFDNEGELEGAGIYGCLYNQREDHMLLDMDDVERRLVHEYMEFLYKIIKENDDTDKVFYIVAFHYLSLCKEIGYDLTESDRAPFPFLGEKISPLGKSNFEKYKEILNGGFINILSCIGIDDLAYYNKIYRNCGYHHHATKYFSLINFEIRSSCLISRYEFDYEFKRKLDIFVFRYKGIYTTERLWTYTDSETKKRVKESLTNIEEKIQ